MIIGKISVFITKRSAKQQRKNIGATVPKNDSRPTCKSSGESNGLLLWSIVFQAMN